MCDHEGPDEANHTIYTNERVDYDPAYFPWLSEEDQARIIAEKRKQRQLSQDD